MRTKGINLLNAKKFVLTRYGEPSWAAVLATLAEEEAAIIDDALVVGWYDMALLPRLFRAIEETEGESDRRIFEHLGTYSAERDLTTTNRLFLRMANPAYVLEKAGEYWHRFHDVGRWTVTRTATGGAKATLEDFIVDAPFCRMLTAYIRRMFELVGAKAVHVEHRRCRARGDTACVFEGSWRQ